MGLLIGGASHTGKTALSEKLMKKYGVPYFSIDHLKMGLIRSGQTALSAMSDDAALTAYLWPIVREMIKPAIAHGQSLIIEGCYIPFDWKKDFDAEYLHSLRGVFLVMSEEYIRTHFDDIKKYANVTEKRVDDSYCTLESVLSDNAAVLCGCKKSGAEMLLIENEYRVDLEL